MKISSLLQKSGREKYFKAFLLGFIPFLLVIIPIMIYNEGVFLYYGDYNSQQIPFYLHAHEFVKSEGVGWDWGTDLGSNFIGSYSFYLLGSPFFWLTIPLPQPLVVFAMPILLAMKTGIASMTAYAYIRRFVRGKNAALIGGMLYAFSGFQLFNIFFNHFHDVTAFFPLMLIALEERVNNNRRGVFALSVALMGLINYFFFTGQAVFVIIYLLVRLKSPDFNITWKKFFSIAAEAVIGALIACVMLLPAALAILGNYRINERLYGLNIVSYSDRTRLLRIIQSFFMIPDVPARPNLFSSDGGKWSSIGGYLPMFSMAGVIAFSRSRKKHWCKRLIAVCIICAVIPILNSAFYTFNSSYYARWYYMPVLIMALMTAQALDDTAVDFRSGIKVCTGVLAALSVISILPKKDEEGKVIWFRFAEYPAHFYITAVICIVGLIILWRINNLRMNRQRYEKTAIVSTVISCMACMAAVVYFGAIFGTNNQVYINTGIHGADSLELEEEENQYYRVDISENYDNYPMFWGLSSMRAFQSIVPGSIMGFYSELGLTRDVASRAPLDNYTLRGLFSVKYYFDKIYTDEKEDYTYEISLPGFEYIGEQNGFYVYENKYYVPMGFAYDNYILSDITAKYTNQSKERILTRAMVLDEKQAEKYSDVIEKLPVDDAVGLDDASYKDDCVTLKRNACSSFSCDSEGFDAKITLDKPKLVFFSVPYESGWRAYVNGKSADIEEVSYGFMAVKAQEGENEIEFRYETPGLKTGAMLSLLGIALLLLYIFITRKSGKSGGFVHYYDYINNAVRAKDQYEYRKINSVK
ncbi:MAG: YfhO family protein [Clostridium sp.]|nr:YfhO family protein [Clostridium sp.]MCM1548284.1 YfhO family protein [Ruminococcus sp.]